MKHKPLQVISVMEGDESRENEITLQMMDTFGWRNVRGGRWCQVELGEAPMALKKYQERKARREENAPVCKRCGRKYHYAAQCFARNHVNGLRLDQDQSNASTLAEPNSLLQSYRNSPIQRERDLLNHDQSIQGLTVVDNSGPTTASQNYESCSNTFSNCSTIVNFPQPTATSSNPCVENHGSRSSGKRSANLSSDDLLLDDDIELSQIETNLEYYSTLQFQNTNPSAAPPVPASDPCTNTSISIDTEMIELSDDSSADYDTDTSLWDSLQICYRCGRDSHTIIECTATFNFQGIDLTFFDNQMDGFRARDRCKRCCRYGHFTGSCFAQIDINGALIID